MKDQQDPADLLVNTQKNRTVGDETQDLSCSESMTNRTYTRIRADIISGVLDPGRKLKVEELRKLYKIGASPIREALSLLSSEHLVERLDQRGFRVAPISLKEFDELLNTRCWLEERALREAITNGNKVWEEQVVIAAFRLSRVPRSKAGDHFIAHTEWEQRHKHFHMALISTCGSSILLKYCDQLYDQNVRYRQLSGVTAYPSRDTDAEHGAITDAVLQRNADLATELLIAHYTQTGNRLKERLSAKTPVPQTTILS